MLRIIKTLVLLFSLIIVETGAQYVAHEPKYNVLYCMILYSIVGLLYRYFLKSANNTKLAVANTIWNIGTELTVAVVGILILRENLTIKQWFGIISCIFGIFLLL